MSAPQLTAYANGPLAVSGDQLNTFMQTCDTANNARGLIGVSGVMLSLRGIAFVNDALGGTFYWNTTSAGPDDNLNVIVPFGAKVGAWCRLTTPIQQAIRNIAALRALTGPTGSLVLTVFVTGFVTGADGGGGTFWYNPGDTTSSDNGGTIFVDASNRRWYRETGLGPLNLLWFGGSGLADYSPALTQALAVATTLSATQPGAEIIIPAARLTFASQVTFNYPATPFSLAIRGAASDASVLTWTSTNGLALNMTIPQHTIHMADLTIACGSQGTSTGIACHQAFPQGLFGQNEFERVTFRGSDDTVMANFWNKALDIVGLGNINFAGLLVYGHGVDATISDGFGVIINGLTSGANPFGIVYNFIDCSFWELAICIEYGTNVQGMAVTACNFTNCTQGIFQPTTAIAGAQLAITNSQFNCFANGIIQGGNLNNIAVSNSLFLVAPNGASGIALAGTGAEHTFTGNVFSTFAAPDPGTNGINITGGALANGTGIITGNTFQGFVTGVNLTGAGNFYVQGNRYVGCTNTVVNPGGSSVNIVGVATE